MNYQKIKGDFSEKYQKNLCDNDGNQLNAVWNITTEYSRTYDNTFGTSIGSPSRTLTSKKELLDLISIINPVEMVYIAYLNGLNKIAVIQNQGRCGEFADAQSFFITDVSGLKTRKIYFIGFDHELPEVYIDTNWYVLDRSFTTFEHPIEAKIYALYLKKNFPLIFTNITGMNSSDASLTVYQEHGFGVE